VGRKEGGENRLMNKRERGFGEAYAGLLERQVVETENEDIVRQVIP